MAVGSTETKFSVGDHVVLAPGLKYLSVYYDPARNPHAVLGIGYVYIAWKSMTVSEVYWHRGTSMEIVRLPTGSLQAPLGYWVCADELSFFDPEDSCNSLMRQLLGTPMDRSP